MKLEVGQKLWLVSRNNTRGSQYVVVTKVGRKWAEITPEKWNRPIHRIDIDTLEADGRGYASPGICYLSKEEYETEVNHEKMWRTFRTQIASYSGAMPSVGAIQQMQQMLDSNDKT